MFLYIVDITSNIISVANISNSLGLSREYTGKYIFYLEQAMLVRRIRKSAKSIEKTVQGAERDVIITCLQFEKYGLPFRSMAIFEDQESINRKVLARFSDVCDKQFSTLATNKERISKYLSEIIEENK